MSRFKHRKAQRLAAKRIAHAKDMQERITRAADRAYEMGRADQNRETCRWVSERTDEGSLVRDYRRYDVKELCMQSVITDEELRYGIPKEAWLKNERRNFISDLYNRDGVISTEEQKLTGITVLRQTVHIAFKPKD